MRFCLKFKCGFYTKKNDLGIYLIFNVFFYCDFFDFEEY